MIAFRGIRLFPLLSVALLSSVGTTHAQERLGFSHDADTVQRIVTELKGFTADDARHCSKAEDAMVQACNAWEACDEGREEIFDSQVGETYIDDRFIVFDVLEAASSEQFELNTEIISAVVKPRFDIELMKTDQSAFDRARDHHKFCKTKIYNAAVRVKANSVKEAENGK